MSGLVRTQVLALLSEIRRQAPDVDITLLAIWQPWVARRFPSQIEAMRRELAAAGIAFVSSPLAVVPSRHFMFRWWLFPVLQAWGRTVFARALRARYDIVHSRSYFASLMAAQLKRRFGHACVFDMRSLFVKEHVTVGVWREGDPNYRFWERLEAWTVRHSEASIGVSPGMIDEIHRIDPAARAELIPIFSNQRVLRFDSEARDRLRNEHGWGNDFVVAYAGSLGHGYQWNNIANVADAFALIRRAVPGARFVILTSDLGIGIEEVLASRGIPRDGYVLQEAPPPGLAGWFSAADAGIHVMSPGPDSQTRLGVKVVEYLSCGLPVIVNRHVGAAADLVDTRGLGAVIDLDKPEEASARLQRLAVVAGALRVRCRSAAEEMFTVERCAADYIALYRSLMQQRRPM
jgi:glycosyltransferase involved in cell wall biosynthesis